jgi:hypothetical protein
MSPPPRKLTRRRAVRGPSRLIVVICGGRRTEPSYFSALKQVFRKPAVKIEISGDGLDPLTLVQSAIERKATLLREARKNKNSFDKNFEIWVVFDRDEFPQIREARELAAKNNIGVAESNPCFELWGILHFEDHDSLDNATECQRKFSRCCPNYDRRGSKIIDFVSFADSSEDRVSMIDAATHRAKIGLQRREDEGEINGRPSTEVFLVVENLRGN